MGEARIRDRFGLYQIVVDGKVIANYKDEFTAEQCLASMGYAPNDDGLWRNKNGGK